MSEHIVKSFTEQLDALANSVAQMGGLAEAQFANASSCSVKDFTMCSLMSDSPVLAPLRPSCH